MIIAGSTGGGKSVLLNNIAIQMWMQKNTISTPKDQYSKGYNILYFSLEMPFKACFRRSMARLADVPIYGLRDSSLAKAETDAVAMACKFIKHYPYKFQIVDIPRGTSAANIEDCFLQSMSTFTPDVVFVDYLGLMTDEEAVGEDWLNLGIIAGKLHEFGRIYNTRVVTAVQLNQVRGGKEKEPSELIGIHRIGRSSLILHHANIGIQIETRKNENLRDTLIYHIIKNRDGEMGKHEIKKKFAHGAIFDVPFIAPKNDDPSILYGFSDEEDISEQVAKIYGISK